MSPHKKLSRSKISGNLAQGNKVSIWKLREYRGVIFRLIFNYLQSCCKVLATLFLTINKPIYLSSYNISYSKSTCTCLNIDKYMTQFFARHEQKYILNNICIIYIWCTLYTHSYAKYRISRPEYLLTYRRLHYLLQINQSFLPIARHQYLLAIMVRHLLLIIRIWHSPIVCCVKVIHASYSIYSPSPILSIITFL